MVFTLEPVVGILTHERLSSAQLWASVASTCSYGKIQFKIQYFKWTLKFLLLDFNGSHAHTLWRKLFCSPLVSQAASTSKALQAKVHMVKTVKNTFVSLRFHTCYYYFMYNYIWLVQIKGWLHPNIMGIKKMPLTCRNVITSCNDTPLWRMWIHGRVQNISIKTPLKAAE